MKIDLDEVRERCKAFRSLACGHTRIGWQVGFWHQESWGWTDYCASPTAALRAMAKATGDEKLLEMLTP